MSNSGKEKQVKLVKANSGLPSHFAAVRYACKCFGVNLPEMARVLKIVRRREKEPDKYFPRKLNRVMLAEAERGIGPWCSALIILGYESLYDRIRRQNGKPLFGFAGEVAERLTFALLRLYDRISPELNIDGVSARDALWVLVAEVFIPTAFLELVLNGRSGLRTEFRLESCWYLPVVKKSEPWGPVRTVLRHWLQAAGFRNAHDLRKVLDSDSARRSADRWLSGQFVPTIGALHGLVERFAKQVEWLDQRDAWKGRFTLACAMEHLYAAMDDFFQARRRNCSLKVPQMLRRIRKDGVVLDDNRVLADPYTFFAARLLQRRLQRDGNWKAKVLKFVSKQAGKTFPADATQEEIDQYRHDMEWRRNPGNWFLEFIEREVVSGGLVGAKRPREKGASLQERILDVGISELNFILDSKRGRRMSTRRP